MAWRKIYEGYSVEEMAQAAVTVLREKDRLREEYIRNSEQEKVASSFQPSVENTNEGESGFTKPTT